MKRKNKLLKILNPRFVAVTILLLIMTCCIYLDSVDYEPSVKAGDVATFKMNVRVEPGENSASGGERLVIGYLVPKSWNAASNTQVNYTSSIDEGTKTMTLMPADAQPKNMPGRTWSAALRERFSFGPNVLDDMEWVVYQTNDVYNVANGEKIKVAVTLKTKTSMDNMRVKLGFFVNNSGDGLSNDQNRHKVMYTDCIDVIDGEGPVIDFCELHINSVQPLYADKNDILTFKYQGDLFENILDQAGEIYFCATAFTDNGHSYEVCSSQEKSKMIKENELARTFTITLWPAGHFGIPANENITKILYSFTNEDGSLVLQQVVDDETHTEVPFEFEFICK